ncbi:MAG: aminopeptidase P family protein [Candidatus Aenigmarchaeota archaeon]|nr:aminopeptidase P family protein [Candidatus Aenigmarchaeota archaeon]
MIKTKKEIKSLIKSAKITDSCIRVIEKSLEENITEIELRRRIGRNIRKQGASLSFNTLVATGKRSAMIHCDPRATKRLISGIGYVDFGARYKGYCTDITVPFIKGNITKKQKRIVDTELAAYKLAINSLKLNQHCWKLFDKVDKYLRKKGYSLDHGLGHGTGKKIHEQPFIVIPKKEKLKRKKKRNWDVIKKLRFQEGMFFSIEPGVYVKGVGGCRLENDVLMTRKGPKVITHSRLLIV